MSNQKISNLKSLNAETVGGEDLIPILDVSSPTSLGGELKKISVNQLIGHIVDLSEINFLNEINNKYDKSGGIISGDVFVSQNINVAGVASVVGQLSIPTVPTANNSATSKQYVDTVVSSSFNEAVLSSIVGASINTKYDKTGGVISGSATITGGLIVNGSSSFLNNISVPISPTSPNHATSKQYVDNQISTVSNLLQIIYPTGSIYISTHPVSPSTLFGFGTWVAFGAGRTLVGFDSGQIEFDAIEKTGGEKSVLLGGSNLPPHTHQIVVPSTSTSVDGDHSHSSTTRNGTSNNTGNSNFAQAGLNAALGNTIITNPNTGTAGAHSHILNIPPFDSQPFGGNQPHNNLQPYITVYMWKRTA